MSNNQRSSQPANEIISENENSQDEHESPTNQKMKSSPARKNFQINDDSSDDDEEKFYNDEKKKEDNDEEEEEDVQFT